MVAVRGGERGLEQTDVECADDVLPRVANRLVGRNVPIVDYEGRHRPGAAALEHLVENRLAQSRAYGPRAIVVEHVRGDAEVALKNRHRADGLVRIQLGRKNHVADRIGQSIAAIEQIPAVEHSQQLAIVAQEGYGRGGDHAIATGFLLCGTAGRRGNQFDAGLFGQSLPFAGKFRRRDRKRSRDWPPLLDGLGHQRIIGQAVTRFSHILCTVHNLPRGVGDDEQVHLSRLKCSLQQRSRCLRWRFLQSL